MFQFYWGASHDMLVCTQTQHNYINSGIQNMSIKVKHKTLCAQHTRTHAHTHAENMQGWITTLFSQSWYSLKRKELHRITTVAEDEYDIK